MWPDRHTGENKGIRCRDHDPNPEPPAYVARCYPLHVVLTDIHDVYRPVCFKWLGVWRRGKSRVCRHSNLGPSIQYMGVFPQRHEAKHWSAPNFEAKNEHSSASNLPRSFLSCTGTLLPSRFTWPWKICVRWMPYVTFVRPPVFLSAFWCGRCTLKVRNHFGSLTGSISVLRDSLTGWTNWATNWSQGISLRLIVT